MAESFKKSSVINISEDDMPFEDKGLDDEDI